jgi:hypothetical protein
MILLSCIRLLSHSRGKVKVSIILLFSIANTYGATYYVATNGNDNNPGTKESPFLTIQKGATLAKAGDVVIIKPGTYKPTNRIQPANSGTQSAPIIFLAEEKDKAIIDGSAAASPTTTDRLGLFTVLGTTTTTQNWIIVDGLRIINSTFVGFYARYASNITFKNCSTFNTGASGIIGANSSDIKVLNNKVQRACQAPSSSLGTNECITMASVDRFEVAYNEVSDRMVDLNNGGEGIDSKNECKDGTVHHNTVFDLVRLGIYIDAYQRNLRNVEVFANKVYKCGAGIGLAIEAGGTLTNVKIHDNIVYDTPKVGIQVRGYLVNGPMKDVFVYQNTVVRTGTLPGLSYENCGILIDADDPGNANFVVRNNIVAECPLQIKTKTFSFLTLDNNLLFGTASTPKPSNPATLYTNAGTNAILANPLFENSAIADFNIKNGSPAIDKAKGSPFSTHDFFDFKRPIDGDIGAIENRKGVVSTKDEAQGINDHFSVYPNPASNIVSVKFEAKADQVYDIGLIDVSGRKLKEVEYISTSINQQAMQLEVDKIGSGLYFISISDRLGNNRSKQIKIENEK